MNLIMPISALWFISELALAVLKRSSSEPTDKKDRSSFWWLWVTILISVSVGVYCGILGIGHIGYIGFWLGYAGIVLILLGLVIRWLAILTLRRFFTVDVAIARGQEIISKGLYGHIRHPAYAGTLLSFLGLGLAFSNWLSIIIIFVPILAAFLYRIKIEEAAMREAFGEPYSDYCRHTRGLIPGIY